MSLKRFTRFPAYGSILLALAVAASSGCRGAALGRLFSAGAKTAGTATRFKPVTLPRMNVPPPRGITALPPPGGFPAAGGVKLTGPVGGPGPALGAVGREGVSSGSTPVIIPSSILRGSNRDRDEDRKRPANPPRLP